MTGNTGPEPRLRRLLSRALGGGLLLLLTFSEIDSITDLGIERYLGVYPGLISGGFDTTPAGAVAEMVAMALALAVGLVLPTRQAKRSLAVAYLAIAGLFAITTAASLLPSADLSTRLGYGMNLIGWCLFWSLSGAALTWSGRLPMGGDERDWVRAAATVLVLLACLVTWAVVASQAALLAGWI